MWIRMGSSASDEESSHKSWPNSLVPKQQGLYSMEFILNVKLYSNIREKYLFQTM